MWSWDYGSIWVIYQIIHIIYIICMSCMSWVIYESCDSKDLTVLYRLRIVWIMSVESYDMAPLDIANAVVLRWWKHCRKRTCENIRIATSYHCPIGLTFQNPRHQYREDCFSSHAAKAKPLHLTRLIELNLQLPTSERLVFADAGLCSWARPTSFLYNINISNNNINRQLYGWYRWLLFVRKLFCARMRH